MAVLTAYAALDMWNLPDWSGSLTQTSGTMFKVLEGSGGPRVGTITGTGFTFGGGAVTNGTITGYLEKSGSTNQYGFTGASVAVAALNNLSLPLPGGLDWVQDASALFFVGNDTLNGSSGSDSLIGYAGGDTLYGNAGHDELYGDVGNDILHGGAGRDSLIGGDDNDILHGGAGHDYLSGGDDNDTLNGNAGNDYLYGDDGNDTLNGGAGIDTADYGDAAGGGGGVGVTVNLGVTIQQNTIGAGLDTLSGIENLTGSSSDDTLTGNAAANVLNGSLGDDTLNGNAGNDTLSGGDGDDTLNGGFGIDTADYGRDELGVTVNLGLTGTQNTVGAGTDTLSGIENLTGSNFDDTLTGNSGNNVLNGGLGDDSLTGGLGNDIFVFNTDLSSGGGSNVDTITDFNVVADTIRLENSIMTGLGSTTGTLAATKFYASPGATAGNDASDRIVYDTASGALYYDADGNGTGAAIQIATIGVNLALTNLDFVVI